MYKLFYFINLFLICAILLFKKKNSVSLPFKKKTMLFFFIKKVNLILSVNFQIKKGITSTKLPIFIMKNTWIS